MTSRTSRRLLATALAIAILGGLAAAPAAGAVPRTFYGVVPQTALSDADFSRMGQGKVGTLRIMINWSVVEPAPDDYQWVGYDGIVAAAIRNGITVLPFLYGTPPWVAQGLDNFNCTSCGLYAPRSNAALLAWRDFVAQTVARYGPGGSFFTENPTLPHRPLRAWQVWNEQNSRDFYRPKPSPKGYAKLLDQAAKAIRGFDPNADVILGGMAEFRRLAAGPKVIAGSDFLDRLYGAGSGVRRDFDGVAPHPYAGKVARVGRQVQAVRKILRERRDGGADLWITELGWASSNGGNPLEVGAKGQATRVRQSLRYFRKNRGKLNVKTVNWFSWMDSETSICEWCANSGLFGPGLVEKPAWKAFVKFTGGS